MTSRLATTLLAALAISAATANGATPEAYAKLDKATEAACIKAANLSGATVGPPMRFSDPTGVDARIVTGAWPQPHMKGASARLLCLYNRKNKRTEVQELAQPQAAQAGMIQDVWWRAQSVNGKAVVLNSEVTMMLGGDGKIGGKSGCNGYSANYQLAGQSLKVMPPMIGTRMLCSPALMAQEQVVRAAIETAQSAEVTSDGDLIVKSANGVITRFTRK
jgi:heat shock protein HslJ